MASAAGPGSDGGATMLERRFSFYAAYHQNPVNQAIHIVCVPLIFWSSLVVAGVLLPGRVTNPLAPAAGGSASDALAPDVPTAIVLAYLAYYLVLSPKLAAMSSGLLVASLVLAKYFITSLGGAYALKAAAAIHVLAWVLQFYGHGKHEGRAPALFESLVQSLLMAPMFICIEVAFRFGFLPAFYKRVEVLVAQRQKEFGTD